MTMDRSLKIHGGLIRSRSVLTRAERIERLTEDGKFEPETQSPFGLPKVRVKHSRAGMKNKKEEKPVAEEGEAAAAEGAAAPVAGKAEKAGKAGKAGKADKAGKK